MEGSIEKKNPLKSVEIWHWFYLSNFLYRIEHIIWVKISQYGPDKASFSVLDTKRFVVEENLNKCYDCYYKCPLIDV
jgi:hypothetical protein